MNNKNKYKLKIRLAKHPFFYRIYKKDFIGFPIIAYVNKQDTLQDIIEKYTMNIIGITIDKTYHFESEKNMILIASNERNIYHPYKKFLRHRPNDFIVITVTPNDNKKVFYPFIGNCF